jgi:hypothetical protein
MNLTSMMAKPNKGPLRLQLHLLEVCREDLCTFYIYDAICIKLIGLSKSARPKRLSPTQKTAAKRNGTIIQLLLPRRPCQNLGIAISLNRRLISYHVNSYRAGKKSAEEESIDADIDGILDGDVTRDSIFDDDEDEEDEVSFLLADED